MIIMEDPKFDHNVANVVRACAAFGLDELIVTGNRVRIHGVNLPFEERCREYQSVKRSRMGKPVTYAIEQGYTPVALEVDPTFEHSTWFEWPEFPAFVFGKEDGGVTSGLFAACHRHVFIPMKHCASVNGAVWAALALWQNDVVRRGLADPLSMVDEMRGVLG